MSVSTSSNHHSMKIALLFSSILGIAVGYTLAMSFGSKQRAEIRSVQLPDTKEVNVTIPEQGNPAKHYTIKIVRYCQDGQEPVDVSSTSSDQLCKLVFPGCALYGELKP